MRIWIDAQSGTWGNADDDFFIVDLTDLADSDDEGARTLRRRLSKWGYPVTSSEDIDDMVTDYLGDSSDSDISGFGRDFGSAPETLTYCGRVKR